MEKREWNTAGWLNTRFGRGDPPNLGILSLSLSPRSFLPFHFWFRRVSSGTAGKGTGRDFELRLPSFRKIVLIEPTGTFFLAIVSLVRVSFHPRKYHLLVRWWEMQTIIFYNIPQVSVSEGVFCELKCPFSGGCLDYFCLDTRLNVCCHGYFLFLILIFLGFPLWQFLSWNCPI